MYFLYILEVAHFLFDFALVLYLPLLQLIIYIFFNFRIVLKPFLSDLATPINATVDNWYSLLTYL